MVGFWIGAWRNGWNRVPINATEEEEMNERLVKQDV